MLACGGGTEPTLFIFVKMFSKAWVKKDGFFYYLHFKPTLTDITYLF